MAKKLFVEANTEAGLNTAVTNNTLNAEVAFIKEQGKEGIHAKGKTYQTVPSNGKNGQVLMSKDGKGVWADLDVTDMLSYGVEWKPNVGDPELTRIGNMNYHKTLPIQSGMKGCIYNPKTKEVVYWLDPNDWRFRENHPKSTEHGTCSAKEDGSIEIDMGSQGSVDSVLNGFGINVNGGLNGDLYLKINGGICKIVRWDTDYITTGVSIGSITVKFEDDYNNFITTGSSIDFSVEYGSSLMGSHGEVFVYVPEFYIKSWDEADRRVVRISPTKIDETWEHQPALFMGAYRDTVLNTVPENMGYLSTLEVNTAISVANNAAYCRGGNNNSANDEEEDVFKRQLGKCRTNIQRSTFRTYTRKASKEIMSYRQYKNILYWLWVIEYANFNSRAAFNSELTSEGFHQGGMGPGLTNVSNGRSYNGYYAISPNGYTNELGNGTGVKLIAPLGPAPIGNVYATRWRGIENPFGDIWHNVDGIIIDADADNHSNNMNYVYTTDDPTKYGDTLTDIANMVLSGLEVPTDGYTKEWDLGTTAEIIPRLMGGNTTQYKCDYHWAGFGTTPGMLLLGGGADCGSWAGLGYFNSVLGVADSAAYVGFRSVSVV